MVEMQEQPPPGTMVSVVSTAGSASKRPIFFKRQHKASLLWFRRLLTGPSERLDTQGNGNYFTDVGKETQIKGAKPNVEVKCPMTQAVPY